MAVVIQEVKKNSKAFRAGIQPGDTLLEINGHPIVDVLDYRFFETESALQLTLSRAGETYQVDIRKPQYGEIGLEFSTYLMDQQRSCRNKCIFCFIDQLPRGMRETLYFKDDDDRLSFLFGNYITLTNIDDREIDRILTMHISPINISVHTMDPELRCKMMNNRFAGESLRHLYRLAQGGIRLNCQIVLCPGINDGDALRFTLDKMMELGGSLQSVACVPVGLTRYREGLYPLTPYTKETAGETVDLIESYGKIFQEKYGSRVVYPADELYLIAQRPLPEGDFYEGYPQIENGVGMLRCLQEEFSWALEDMEPFTEERHVTVVTGEAGAAFLDSMLDELRQKCHNLHIDLVPIHNDFFGGTVNITGLVTGQDILAQLSGRDLGDALLVPSSMLKAEEDIFLDDVTLDQLGETLGVSVMRVENTGEDTLAALLGRAAPAHRSQNYYEGAGDLPYLEEME